MSPSAFRLRVDWRNLGILPRNPGNGIVASAGMSPEGLTFVIPVAWAQPMLRRVTQCT